MDKEQMKSEITKLIEKYNREKGKRYNEEATKKDFILPLFKMIGWDVDNSNEVTPEDNVSRKRVDYAFKIDGIPKFYLEAKPLDENLDGYREQNGIKTTFAQQSVNYAYYKGCIWAILTNFSEIRIYDAWTRDTASGFRFAIRIDNFVNDFDNGLYLLSKEAFKQGELDKKYSTKSRKKPITEQLLSDFTKFRAILSKDVYALNKSKNLTEEELDEAIQRLFDRLIFIRNCEDRELEPYELLSALRQWKENRKGTLVGKLRTLFAYYDDTYDSKIFGDGKPHLCDQVDISDNVLSRILDGLYTTEDGSIQYDFSLIDADVLGNIYEQYLGHILKKTEKRTKLTESKAKRKEEGIYYTPSYIVDYIVRNTVGELIKNKKIDVSKIKVLDPACGSGSFLIKTFDVLNEYHSKKEGYSQNKLDMSGTGTTYSTKLSILKDNIFGVDLDKQAVDIAQLNLLLKVAEKKRRLPILQQNIKNGNSLIDDPNITGDKAFKWNEEFAEIMNNGGFDVVVGNPPYINIKLLTKTDTGEKEYYQQNYNVACGSYDIYILFIERAIKLLNDNGKLGFIIPNKFTVTNYGLKLRKFILDTCIIEKIIDVSHLPVFKGVGIYPIILILKKESSNDKRLQNKISFLSAKSEDDLSNIKRLVQIKQESYIKNDENIFAFGGSSTDDRILDKIKKDSVLLGNIATVNCGTTGFEYMNWGKLISDKIVKGEDYLPFIITGNIDHYALNQRKPVRYQGKKLTSAYFKKGKEVTAGKWALFSSKKIVIRGMALELTAAYDEIGCACGVSVYTVTEPKNDADTLYLLALLNSKLIDYFYKSQFMSKHLAGRYIGYNKGQIEQIPVRLASKKAQETIIQLAEKRIKLTSRVNDMLQTDESANLKEEINDIDKKIDTLVLSIYGITEEEKKVIEESLK